MPVILQLDSHLADLIAAGEVVERPASAAKELVENAIDAGATEVTVEIQNGGTTFLRVTDNGCGMEPADARTAFLRHATSKLRTASDLGSIATLGFRGEALAAISAVSKIDLLTKTPQSQNGVSLHLEAGKVLQETPAGCPDGTTILVRDLFYNTPARMKFLKSDSAEGSAIFAAVQRQALAHPEVSFRFLKDGQEQLHTSGDGVLSGAVYQVLGRQAAGEMVPVKSKWESYTISGCVTRPTATRGNRNYQYFFVNGRYIKSKLLSAALEEAYKNQIQAGRFPACVLHISVPVQTVDVNVHPAKTEIKFLSERGVFDAVHYGVLSVLNHTPGKPEMKLPQRTPTIQAAPQKDFFKSMTAAEYRGAAQRPAQTTVLHDSSRLAPQRNILPSSVKKELSSEQELAELALELALEVPAAAAVSKPEAPVAQPKEPSSPAEPVKVSNPEPKPIELPKAEPVPAETPKTESVPAAIPETEPQQQTLDVPEQPYRVIGEALNTYILVEQDEALLFIDKHAAHERVLFEKLKAQPQSIMSQSLLTPLPTSLSREEAAAVLENAELFARCGFGVEDFGDGTVLLREVPCELAPEDAQRTLSQLAGQLLGGRPLDPEGLRDRLLHSIACKAAIKAGWHTEDAERDALVREVLSREDLKYCPHGRPICTVLTKKQLEKQFKRA